MGGANRKNYKEGNTSEKGEQKLNRGVYACVCCLDLFIISLCGLTRDGETDEKFPYFNVILNALPAQSALSLRWD